MNQEKINAIIEDGVVDASEVEELRDIIFEDGVVDKEEVKALFEINDAVSGNDNDPEWEELMVEAVVSFCLEDENTPGVVDKEEGDFLADLIEGDGEVDDVEIAVLTALSAEAELIESDRLNTLISGYVS
jgi:uncharacterized tellurite resistance protein B-like protein